MKYQLIENIFGQPCIVKRITDSTFIPFTEGNTDYQEYLEWLAEGNEPLPADN